MQLPEPEAVAVLHFAANRLQLAYQTYMVDDDLTTPSEEPPTDRNKPNGEVDFANLQGLFAKLELEEREVSAFPRSTPQRGVHDSADRPARQARFYPASDRCDPVPTEPQGKNPTPRYERED